MGDANPIRTLGDYSKPSHEGYMNTIELSVGNNVLPDRNVEESWALLEDLTLYDNESWNDLNDFAKPVKAISLPQDVLSTSDRRLIELENQVQRLMEAHLAPTQPTQVNKITSSCEICSGPHDTQYCMENPEQAFVDYASFYQTKLEKALIDFDSHQEKRLSNLRTQLGQQQGDMIKQNRNPSSPKSVYFVNSIVILNKEDEAKEEGNVKTSTTKHEDHEMTLESEEEFEEEIEEEDSPKQINTFPTMKELRYHEWLLKKPRPPWVKIKIMIKRLGPRRKPSNPGKICNFVGRVKGLKFFVRNFNYECDFMVLEDTTSVTDHDLGSVIFRKPFVEATGLVYDKEEGTITFEKDKEKIVFKMPHKMKMFKHIDFMDIKTDRIPPFAIESDDDNN
ncbi:hypothetical protein Tco_1286287 [Tanacetum coccineum]